MKHYFSLLATTGVVAALTVSAAFAAQQNQNPQDSQSSYSSGQSQNQTAQHSNQNSQNSGKQNNASSGIKGQNADWSYSGKNGPENWGKISKQYSLCKEGKNQSPVNISDFKQTNLPKIDIDYKSSSLNIVNNGHTVEVDYNKGSNVTIGGQKFDLQQLHFHTPSEHTIQGKNSPLEVHFVNKNEQGKLSVIAVMVEQGKENPELQKIWNNIPKKPGQEVSYNNVTVNAQKLLPENQQYFTYTGSLTTPPCSEQVSWYVMKQPIQASKEQIKSFKEVYQYNARPQQPLKGRQIQGS